MRTDLNTILITTMHESLKAISLIRNISEDKAIVLFQDVLRYLWIADKHADEKNRFPDKKELQCILVMHEEMCEIDNMWHNFILYTHD